MQSVPVPGEKREGPSDMGPEDVLGLREGALNDLGARVGASIPRETSLAGSSPSHFELNACLDGGLCFSPIQPYSFILQMFIKHLLYTGCDAKPQREEDQQDM